MTSAKPQPCLLADCGAGGQVVKSGPHYSVARPDCNRIHRRAFGAKPGVRAMIHIRSGEATAAAVGRRPFLHAASPDRAQTRTAEPLLLLMDQPREPEKTPIGAGMPEMACHWRTTPHHAGFH